MPRTESRGPEDARDHLSERRRRADAERSIVAIVEAAFNCLCENPGVTMSAIARAAGVGRVTLYAHFPTRKALVDAVARRAVAQAAHALDAEAPDEGPAREALARLAGPGWRVLDRCRHLAAAIAGDLPPARHREVQDLLLDRVERLIVRGQDEGAFRVDVPRAWLAAMIYGLMHTAAQEVDAGRLSQDQAGAVLKATLLSAVERPATPDGHQEDRIDGSARPSGPGLDPPAPAIRSNPAASGRRRT
jgi:TetR/AcrR family transcriptional repressor of mexCD-oprJ operon